MIVLPVLDQGNLEGCQSYAVANLSTGLLALNDIHDRIYPVKLYNETERNGAPSIWSVLEYAQKTGMLGETGMRYRISLVQPIKHDIDSVRNALNSYHGLLMTFSTHIGNQLNLENFELRRPSDAHAVVIVDDEPEKYRFKVLNSWGSTWGDHGFFYLPYAYLGNPDIQTLLAIQI